MARWPAPPKHPNLPPPHACLPALRTMPPGICRNPRRADVAVIIPASAQTHCGFTASLTRGRGRPCRLMEQAGGGRKGGKSEMPTYVDRQALSRPQPGVGGNLEQTRIPRTNLQTRDIWVVSRWKNSQRRSKLKSSQGGPCNARSGTAAPSESEPPSRNAPVYRRPYGHPDG